MGTIMKLKLIRSYVIQKICFTADLTSQKYIAGEIAFKDVWSMANDIFDKKMTYFYCNKGSEMEPTLTPHDTLLVRKFPFINTRKDRPQIKVGDVVVLKDPMDPDNRLVRRLAAVEGYRLDSLNEVDEPFFIKHGQGWVLSDNNRLHPKERKDSRTYGPIAMSDILGTVIYRYRTIDDQGFVKNGELSLNTDLPVYFCELDKDEIRRYTDKQKQTKSCKSK